MNNFKNILRNLYDIQGVRTKRKIVVIESDDWGAIRMPSIEVKNSIPEKYQKHFNSPYYRYDTIASPDDLSALFEVLHSVKDKNRNSAIITANTIVANPDFDRIEQSEFCDYYFEYFTETLTAYYGEVLFKTWKEGIRTGCFVPQLHGREHVNVALWMKKLSEQDNLYLDAFKRRIYSVDHNLDSAKKNLTAALEAHSESDSIRKAAIVDEGCKIFEKIFDYKTSSFIAPSYTWDTNVEKTLHDNEVSAVQGIRVQKIPTQFEGKYRYKRHFMGQRNRFNQYYLVRNAFFEPNLFENVDTVNETLSRIKWSFKFSIPAILSMHRLNVVGGLDLKRRDENLFLLKDLLKKILKQWPEVEFLSTPQVTDQLLKKQSV